MKYFFHSEYKQNNIEYNFDKILKCSKDYIKFIPGVTPVLFYGSLLGVLKPIEGKNKSYAFS